MSPGPWPGTCCPTWSGSIFTCPARRGTARYSGYSAVYEAIAAAGIRYAHEPPSDQPDSQEIRSPAEVLWAPRHATCLDLAITFAGACLKAGLDPLILLIEHGREPAAGTRWSGSGSRSHPRTCRTSWTPGPGYGRSSRAGCRGWSAARPMTRPGRWWCWIRSGRAPRCRPPPPVACTWTSGRPWPTARAGCLDDRVELEGGCRPGPGLAGTGNLPAC